MGNRKLNLEAEMKRNEVSRNDLAKALKISTVSLQKKITGEREFKCKEMFATQKRLGTDKSLDELFK